MCDLDARTLHFCLGMFIKFLSYHGKHANTVKPYNSRTNSSRANHLVPKGFLYSISNWWWYILLRKLKGLFRKSYMTTYSQIEDFAMILLDINLFCYVDHYIVAQYWSHCLLVFYNYLSVDNAQTKLWWIKDRNFQGTRTTIVECALRVRIFYQTWCDTFVPLLIIVLTIRNLFPNIFLRIWVEKVYQIFF